ncbi:hypothetical protein P167DRAFT_233212 [Morchella conica CCBAS932]|uniref:Uncharacterized protein n=1 Tax=Morchella conica CCBAS932 TaxID=1392247 RepID=A0A3N4KKE3_9PEZI|nr:hypothetical protein P167DRAFT_233212 [Morchella conica CCBAS932]
MCRGYFNTFAKPVVECQPPVGKAYKITISMPILHVTLGSKLIPKKTAERVLRHHPSFLRAPGYEYAETYIDQDGKEQPKPGAWIYGSALDHTGVSFSAASDYDGSTSGTPPTVFTGRTLFEYHHPKMDALTLDLRQTMRRGNRGHYDDDEFLVVEQLWAVIIPTKETLITFQSMKKAVIPGQVGGFNSYMFEPSKGADVTPQGPVHGFLIYFADLVLLQHYHILEAFKEGTAALNFRVAHKPIADEELVADCNAVISEVAIILEITKKQMEILGMIKEAAIDNTLRPEEFSAANEFYKYMMGRFEIVVATFEDIGAEAKQAQDLLFQLLNIEASKKQVAMAIQQEIIARQTAEETAVQLELAKQAAEQAAFQVKLAKQSTEQNKSFLVFTIITTIFLPLSFFTSVRPPLPSLKRKTLINNFPV